MARGAGAKGIGEACGVALGLARFPAASSANDCRLTGSFFSFLFCSGRGSTNRPIQSSVPGYEIGPTVRVVRAIHSISCAGGSASLLAIAFEDFLGLSDGVVGCLTPGVFGSSDSSGA